MPRRHGCGIYADRSRQLNLPVPRSGSGCEACHGPGAKHADSEDPADIFLPRRTWATTAPRLCLDCHQTGHTLDWEIGFHAESDVACLSCHKMHDNTTRKALLADSRGGCLFHLSHGHQGQVPASQPPSVARGLHDLLAAATTSTATSSRASPTARPPATPAWCATASTPVPSSSSIRPSWRIARSATTSTAPWPTTCCGRTNPSSACSATSRTSTPSWTGFDGTDSSPPHLGHRCRAQCRSRLRRSVRDVAPRQHEARDADQVHAVPPVRSRIRTCPPSRFPDRVGHSTDNRHGGPA